MSGERRLVQLHWQNRQNLGQTEFVAQGEFDNVSDFEAWAADLMTRRGGEMPAGWCPLTVLEGSPYFVYAAPESSNGGQPPNLI